MTTETVNFLNTRPFIGDFGGAYDDMWSMVGTTDPDAVLSDDDAGTYVDQKQVWGDFIDDPPVDSSVGYLHGPRTLANLTGVGGSDATVIAATLHYKVQLVDWEPDTDPTMQVQFNGGAFVQTVHIPLTVGTVIEDSLDLSLDESFDGGAFGSATGCMNALRFDQSVAIVTQHGDPADQESARANGATEIYLYEFWLEVEAVVPYQPFAAAMDAALRDVNQAFSGN